MTLSSKTRVKQVVVVEEVASEEEEAAEAGGSTEAEAMVDAAVEAGAVFFVAVFKVEVVLQQRSFKGYYTDEQFINNLS